MRCAAALSAGALLRRPSAGRLAHAAAKEASPIRLGQAESVGGPLAKVGVPCRDGEAAAAA